MNVQIVNNRDQSLLLNELKSFKEREKKRYQIVATNVGGVVGTIAAVAVWVFSCYSLITIPTVEVFYDGGSYFDLAPGTEMKFIFYIFGLVGVFPALVGAAIGGAASLPFWLLCSYKTHQASKILNKIEKKYGSNCTLSLKDIGKIIGTVDKQVRTSMMSTMTFAELAVTRKVLGSYKFRSINKNLNGHANQLWHMIDTPNLKDPDFKDNLHYQMTMNPLFKQAVQKHLPKALPPIIRNDSQTIQLKIGNEMIAVKSNILTDHFGYFRRLLNPPEAEFKTSENESNQLELKEIDPNDFKSMIKFVENGQLLTLCGQELINVAGLLDYFSAQRCLDSLDVVIAGSTTISIVEKMALIKSFPHTFKTTKDGLINYILSVKDHSNWEKRSKLARSLSDNRVTEKLQGFAESQIDRNVKDSNKKETILWLDRLSKLPHSNHRAQSALLRNIKMDNIRFIYELSKEIQMEPVHQACMQFIQDNAGAIRESAIWKIGQYPAEVRKRVLPFINSSEALW